MEAITFSRASLLAFLACKRRFQLRYLDKLSWPDLPFSTRQRSAIEQGQKFHQSVERFFLGLGVNEPDPADSELRLWWDRFKENVLPLPSGRALPELRLTVPVGGHFLTGRYDLVIIGDDGKQATVHIYDWKTSRPRTVSDLETEWQTRLYLAMLAESGNALGEDHVVIRPEQISLTYWYVTDPQIPRTLSYSEDKHRQNWTDIELVVSEINAGLKENDWPLTDNWSHCRTCAYGTYCGRFEGGAPEKMVSEDEIEYDVDSLLLFEPESP